MQYRQLKDYGALTKKLSNARGSFFAGFLLTLHTPQAASFVFLTGPDEDGSIFCPMLHSDCLIPNYINRRENKR
jgi:hypothetical protein